MKRFLILFLTFAFIMTAAGCGGGAPQDGAKNDGTAAEETPLVSDGKTAIYDGNGAGIGALDSRANCTAADGGIFYSVFDVKEFQFTGSAEYRFFDKESKKDILLGTVANQGYEALFARTEHGGVIYTLVIEGDPMSDSPVPLVLLAFDPEAGTMKKHTVAEDGFPYTSMAAANGRLLIMNHETKGTRRDVIYEYDPETEAVREALTFSPDTDSLRGVCSSKDGFYILRLKINRGAENVLFLDKYSGNYEKISELSLTETLVGAASGVHGMTGRGDALNELGMNVSGFEVVDERYLFYENFGLLRVIADLQSGDALFANDDNYSMSAGGGVPYFYRMDFDSENVPEPDIQGISGGKLVKHGFKPDAAHKLIREVSHSPAGTWLVKTSDIFSAQNSSFALHLWTE